MIVRRAGGVISAGLVAAGLAACQVRDLPAPEQAAPSPAATSAASRPPGSPAGTWHLVFNSTFTGGVLNRADWSTGWLANGITPPVSKGELECYDPANVSVAGGALSLSLIRQAHSCGGRVRPTPAG